MVIRLLDEGDLVKILPIIEEAKKTMAQFPMDQWQKGYPNRETMLGYIEQKKAYVTPDADAVAALIPMDADYGAYEEVLGHFVVIHTMAVCREKRGTGYAKEFHQALEDRARELGYEVLAVDTHRENKTMLRFIEKMGYLPLGEVYIGGKDHRLAFYKKL